MKEIKVGYYENGNVEYEIPFENDMQHGVEKWYDENGNLIRETLYENDVVKEYDKNGKNRS